MNATPGGIRIFLFMSCALWSIASLHLETKPSRYPLIPDLSSLNPVFRQYSDDVSAARIALAGADAKLPLGIYSYRVKSGETLISIAARCSIPYDSIAGLNRIPSATAVLEGKTLLLPTLPGLYLPDQASSDFEHLLLSSFDPASPLILSFTVYDPHTSSARPVHCIPAQQWDGTVRAFFLKPYFTFPLPQGVLTSSFGYRKNPITGNLIFHKGVDLAAPRGTPVLACRDGTVIVSSFDPVYGNYLILRHDGGRESLYGHLETKKIELHGRVKSGTILGTVGSTGQSTGPHLHFEIHENGVPKNPAGFIKGN